MYVSPQERSFDPLAAGLGGFDTTLDDDPGDDGLPSLSGTDAVSRLLPPFVDPFGALDAGASAASAGFGALGGALSPLIGSLGQLLSRLSQQLGAGSSAAPGEQYYGNATGSSTGDPHLAFQGGGTNATWDSMSSHGDLLDSDSFRGGYRLSTQTTAPDANGVTYNGSATVTTQDGRTAVSLDNAGNATISRDGRSYALADGERYDLGSGETVSRAADGSVEVDERNRNGGSIATTLSENGRGVDARVAATNVRLGGDLTGGGRSAAPLPHGHRPHRPLGPPEKYAPLPQPYRV